MPTPSRIRAVVDDVLTSTHELRRALHRVPEPANQEFRTTELIASFLEAGGLVPRLRSPNTGLWVDLGEPPVVGFRADLDALPIDEPAHNTPRSENPGWMHACGHDAHAAIAAGIALAMSRLAPEAGVRVLFQPAEEAFPGGAAQLVAEGVVDGLKGLIAFHVDPALEPGLLGMKSGPITGSADAFTIDLSGPGGHTSRPHKTVDLVAAAARVVSELPAAIRSKIDARTPVVTVFGAIHGGDAANVIPTKVTLRGTVRTPDRSLWDVLPGLVDEALAALLRIDGADYVLDYRQGIPPVVNDGAIVSLVGAAMRRQLGESATVGTETSMGGEDFANYLELVPGAMVRLGAASGGGDLHSATFSVNEAAIGVGVEAGVASILGLLSEI